MSVPCVCGHAEFLHANGPCMRFFLSCHCQTYEPDDGVEHPYSEVNAKAGSDPYTGIYGRREHP